MCIRDRYSIYAGVTAAKAVEVYHLLLDEMQDILKNGLDKEEFIRAKEQLKGNYILGLESTSSRMNAIGRSMVTVSYTHLDVYKRQVKGRSRSSI